MAKHIVPDIPYVYQGSAPSCPETTLRMVFAFRGLKFSSSYLRNLSGFDYGFTYFKGNHFAVACAESPMGPWPHMAYAAGKLGCAVTLIQGKPWDESWSLMRSTLDKNVPIYMPLLNMQYLWKTAFPVPHIVLLCGYDEEKGVVMIHDPALGEFGEGIQYLPTQYAPRIELQEGELHEGKSGNYAEFKLEDFKKACDLAGTPWQDFWKNGFATISPGSDRPAIPWAEVIERNGKITLGLMGQVVGADVGPENTYGPAGLQELASDVETGFGLPDKPKAVVAILGLLRGMTFHVGADCKKDGQAFLSGLAAATNSRNLEEASYEMRFTANCYDQGLAEIDQIFQKKPLSQEILSRPLSRIAELLRRAAGSERRAGESLRSAAKVMG